jgi:hypothetical protein
MLITVQRDVGDANCTPGVMSLDAAFQCFTLEPRRDQSQGKPFCIPAGTYAYEVGLSAHFGFSVIKVLNVPGFTDIEVHPGNYPSNTHGCTCVGETQSTDFIGESDAAFNALMAKIPPTGQIQYVDPTPAFATT